MTYAWFKDVWKILSEKKIFLDITFRFIIKICLY